MKEELLMRSGVKGLNVQWTELLYEPRMGKLLFSIIITQHLCYAASFFNTNININIVISFSKRVNN